MFALKTQLLARKRPSNSMMAEKVYSFSPLLKPFFSVKFST
jgi:hypothetical protein